MEPKKYHSRWMRKSFITLIIYSIIGYLFFKYIINDLSFFGIGYFLIIAIFFFLFSIEIIKEKSFYYIELHKTFRGKSALFIGIVALLVAIIFLFIFLIALYYKFV